MSERSRRSPYTRSGTRRLGDEYQDLIALDVLVDWLEHPDRYHWVRVEADEVGVLDDVVAVRADGALLPRQVKYATDAEAPDDPWTWEALLAVPKARSGGPRVSLLQRWANSLARLPADYPLGDAAVVSNRRPGPDLQRALTPDGQVDFDRVDAATRAAITRQLGDEARARAVFARLRFDLNQPGLGALEEGLRRRFYRLGGSDAGWANLRDALRVWVCHHHQPPPDGAITLAELRRAALWHQLQALPQHLDVPPDYVVPDAFHAALVEEVCGSRSRCLVLTGSPGIGKSTYASYLYQELRAAGVPAIRHHYFLSFTDRERSFRLEHQRAAESLMHDLASDYPDTIKGIDARNPVATDLGRWLEAAGAHVAGRGMALIVIVDGLDHVWRERRSIEELDRLLAFLLPPAAEAAWAGSSAVRSGSPCLCRSCRAA